VSTTICFCAPSNKPSISSNFSDSAPASVCTWKLKKEVVSHVTLKASSNQGKHLTSVKASVFGSTFVLCVAEMPATLHLGAIYLDEVGKKNM